MSDTKIKNLKWKYIQIDIDILQWILISWRLINNYQTQKAQFNTELSQFWDLLLMHTNFLKIW